MQNQSKITDKILRWKPLAWLIRVSRLLVLPGFNEVPLYDVAVFFIRGLTKGFISTRAAAISYSLFLAILPFMIFLFTIIPFIPIRDFQQSLLSLIQDFLPDSAYATVKSTIIDIVTQPRSSLLIITFFLALYFSTNGVNSLIAAFNDTYHDLETRSAVKQYIISIFIVFILSILLILAISLITFGSSFLSWILPGIIENSLIITLLLELLRWIVILALLLMAISSVYYLAPARRKHFHFISAGSLVATILIMLTTLGFNFYVDNFASYNAFYGSLATVMIILVWIYINSYSLLIGFELNASIYKSKHGIMNAGKI
ncbi:MAG: YihY/virulence factor BrkB family protein [Bacteroidales bacterium]|nr:YihY/virulence factor BrkB family protein [Bacteroidales bacterium]